MGLLLLLPATGLTLAAYIALYISGKSEGGMRTFGKVLAGWILLLAALIAIAGLSSPFFDGRPFGISPRMHRPMDGQGMRRGRMMGPPPAGAPAPGGAAETAPPPPPAAPAPQ